MLKNKNKMYLIRRMFFINKKKIKFLRFETFFQNASA